MKGCFSTTSALQGHRDKSDLRKPGFTNLQKKLWGPGDLLLKQVDAHGRGFFFDSLQEGGEG